MRRGTPLVLVVEYAGHVRKSCAPQHHDNNPILLPFMWGPVDCGIDCQTQTVAVILN